MKGMCQNQRDELAELDMLLITLQATAFKKS